MKKIFEVERAFTRAAVDSSAWAAAMDTIALATSSVGAVVFPVEGRVPITPCSESLVGTLETYFRDGWVRHDERSRGIPQLKARGVFGDLEIATIEEIGRHPFYQEFLAPAGLRWSAVVKLAVDDELWCVSIQRSVHQMPFSDSELTQLGQLSKKISGAATLSRALGFARAEAALAAFEVSSIPVALLDRRGEVIQINQSAEGIFDLDPQILRRKIVSRDRGATANLNRALHDLFWNSGPSSLSYPIRLPRARKKDLIAYPMRIDAISRDSLGACQAVIVFVDLDQHKSPPENVLKVCFNLTTAEARLAVHLATGTTLEGAAESLMIAKGTARNQLKAIFFKTRTSRQAELAVLLGQLLPNTLLKL